MELTYSLMSALNAYRLNLGTGELKPLFVLLRGLSGREDGPYTPLLPCGAALTAYAERAMSKPIDTM
jgi:hypothetical protein